MPFDLSTLRHPSTGSGTEPGTPQAQGPGGGDRKRTNVKMKQGASPILSVLSPLPWWERVGERGPSVAGASAGMTVNRSRGRFQIAEPDRLGRVPVHVVGRVVVFPEGAFLGLASEDGNGFTLSAHVSGRDHMDQRGFLPQYTPRCKQVPVFLPLSPALSHEGRGGRRSGAGARTESPISVRLPSVPSSTPSWGRGRACPGLDPGERGVRGDDFRRSYARLSESV